MKKILFLSTFVIVQHILTAQTSYSKETEAQIKQVENSLAGRIKMEGKSGYNLIERMAELNVKGLSIAVVQNYKIIPQSYSKMRTDL